MNKVYFSQVGDPNKWEPSEVGVMSLIRVFSYRIWVSIKTEKLLRALRLDFLFKRVTPCDLEHFIVSHLRKKKGLKDE